MNFAAAERIARALLYEGYLLYPYRKSAVKNQRRWTFGCLLPLDYPQPDNSAEGSFARTECLLLGDEKTEIEVRARFLQQSVEGVVERKVAVGSLRLAELIRASHHCAFAFPPIEGAIEVWFQRCGDDLFNLCVELRNRTSIANGEQRTRDEALPSSLLSSHIVMGVTDGRFLSMQDPPDMARDVAASCRSVRTWPILIGDPERCDMLLAAPIILSDFPQIAAESSGDLFDATEMDEILTLRIRTLTLDEKQAMAATDPRHANLLHQAEEMDERQLCALHGVWSSDEKQAADDIAPGTRVRLRPKRNADVYDLALADKTAVVVSIERDFEDRVYATVALDDDPGQDYGIAGRPGHRFFFGLDEVEVIEPFAPEVVRVMPSRRILIAGIGNIFFGDDAFGVEVVRRLIERPMPEGVVVRDFGIRGFDLACALQDGYDAAILVDAMQWGDAPGTLRVIEPDTESCQPREMVEMHHLDPVRVIDMVRQMSGSLPCLRVVGCEPETLEPNENGSLSPVVQNAVAEAVVLIEKLVANLLCGHLEAVG